MSQDLTLIKELTDKFYPDEGCIRTGILTESTAVLKILEEESKTW